MLLFGLQPFVVTETFTARPGVYLPVAETVRGYGELVDGRHDGVPAQAFRFTSGIVEVLAKAGGMCCRAGNCLDCLTMICIAETQYLASLQCIRWYRCSIKALHCPLMIVTVKSPVA